MITKYPEHLGDGAYIGQDPQDPLSFWLGANHHENMTVCLGPKELARMMEYIIQKEPRLKKFLAKAVS